MMAGHRLHWSTESIGRNVWMFFQYYACEWTVKHVKYKQVSCLPCSNNWSKSSPTGKKRPGINMQIITKSFFRQWGWYLPHPHWCLFHLPQERSPAPPGGGGSTSFRITLKYMRDMLSIHQGCIFLQKSLDLDLTCCVVESVIVSTVRLTWNG